ncbi:MAG: diacylglycerol kinase family protein [Candidatus Caldatribacteriaceae bacterium]
MVAYGSVFGNREKVNSTVRILMGLSGVIKEPIRIVYLPDPYDLVGTAKKEVERILPNLSLFEAPIPVLGDGEDTLNFTEWAVEEGVEALLVVGGDGTNRLVAKRSGSVPLFSISGGTNNVFASSVEPTIAGMALGFYLSGQVKPSEVVERSKVLRCETLVGKEKEDLAIVDLVLVNKEISGTKAIWEPELVQFVAVTQSSPLSIGLSAVVGRMVEILPQDRLGAYVELGEPGVKVKVPLAPGLVREMSVKHFHFLEVGKALIWEQREGILALDGERELPVRKEEVWKVVLEDTGPWRANIERIMNLARERGVYDG